MPTNDSPDQDSHPGPGEVRHRQARALAEKALDEYAKNDTQTGNELTEEAASLDPSAVDEVLAEHPAPVPEKA